MSGLQGGDIALVRRPAATFRRQLADSVENCVHCLFGSMNVSFGNTECLVRVVHARSSGGAGRPLSLALLPFTHRRQLCVRQRTLGQIASMPATGQEAPFAKIPGSRHSTERWIVAAVICMENWRSVRGQFQASICENAR
jgi:hypothetical protein